MSTVATAKPKSSEHARPDAAREFRVEWLSRWIGLCGAGFCACTVVGLPLAVVLFRLAMRRVVITDDAISTGLFGRTFLICEIRRWAKADRADTIPAVARPSYRRVRCSVVKYLIEHRSGRTMVIAANDFPFDADFRGGKIN